MRPRPTHIHCRKRGDVDFNIPMNDRVVIFYKGQSIKFPISFEELVRGLQDWDYDDEAFEALKKDLMWRSEK